MSTLLNHFSCFQAIIALIPAFVIIGLSWNVTMLYIGLSLYSFGESKLLYSKYAVTQFHLSCLDSTQECVNKSKNYVINYCQNT